MPYSKNASQQTYDTKRITFVSNPQQRSSDRTKDARLLNVMTEVLPSTAGESKRVVVKTRPGLAVVGTVNTGVGRGIYYWIIHGVGYTFTVVDNLVYVNGVYNSTIDTSTGDVGFVEHVSSVAVVSLVLVDGSNGYVWTNPTLPPVKISPSIWQPNTYYDIGTKVTAPIYTSYSYTVTVAGTSGSVNPFKVFPWVPGFIVDEGHGLVGPTVPNTFFYQAGAPGIAGTTEPIWPTTLGGTVVDGGVTWTCIAGTKVDSGVTWQYEAGIFFPYPHLPFPIFLDGYLFLAKSDTQDVYNSDLDDPKIWTSGSFLSAEMYPDTIKALSKNNNYIYAIGSDSVEYMYDVANATGTPLGRHPSAVQQFGCAAPMTVVQTEKEVIFVGTTKNGGNTVWTIDGFTPTEIGIPAVKSAFLAEGDNLAMASACCIRASGQKLYFIHLTDRTFVYSFDTQMWHEWGSGPDGNSPLIIVHADGGPLGTSYALGRNGGNYYAFTEDSYTDGLDGFLCQITTPKQDFDSINRKFLSRLAIIGDVPDATDAENTVWISWSDDDYRTWSDARPLSFNNDFPVITQLGTCRRRAFRIHYTLPHLIRFEGLEIDYNKGQQ